nr:Uncharacterised protein [Raoultella sp. NCTC 9187]
MVAGGAHAAKRRFAGGAGQRLVPVDDPGARFVAEPGEQRRVGRNQPRRQPVAGVIRHADRLIKLLVAHDRQQRAKILFVGHVDPGDVDNPRREQRGVRVRLGHAQQHLTAEAFQLVLRRQHCLRRLQRDNAAHKRLRFGIPAAGANTGAGGNQPLQQRVALLPVSDQQPPGAGAALPGGNKRRLDNHVQRRVDIGRVGDDQRVCCRPSPAPASSPAGRRDSGGSGCRRRRCR